MTESITLLPDGYLLAGRHRIVKRLSAGGFGVVYLAKDTTLNDRLVVVKQNKHPSPSNEFKGEAIRLAHLRHPNLPVVIEYFEESKPNVQQFIVVQFIDGPDLGKLLSDRHGDPLPLDQVLICADKILSALDYLHTPQTQKSAIIHRDIKPANIIMAKQEIYLVDFGIAKDMEE